MPGGDMVAQLKEATRIYQQMREMLLEIDRQISSNTPKNLGPLVQQYRELDVAGRRQDKKLLQFFEDGDHMAGQEEVLHDHRMIMQEVATLVNAVLPKAAMAKTFLANEATSLKRGRKAISGYKSGNRRHGRIVNRKS